MSTSKCMIPRRFRPFSAASSMAVMLAVLAIAFGVPNLVRATTLKRVDTRELTVGSSDIVIGTVAGSRSYWNEKHTRIFTDVTIHVERTLKGAGSQELTLTQLGGTVDGARYSIPGCPVFRAGEEALFFVWRDPRGRAQVNGLAQGKFDIRREPVSGERTVQRMVSGFAVGDVRALKPVPEGLAPRLALADLVREIEAVLAEPASPGR